MTQLVHAAVASLVPMFDVSLALERPPKPGGGEEMPGTREKCSHSVLTHLKALGPHLLLTSSCS